MLDGLTEEQARRRLVPSPTCPLALVKHAVFVEKVWFHVSLAGRTRAEVGVPEAAEDSWVLHGDDTIASVSAEYRTGVGRGRRVRRGDILREQILAADTP